MMMRRRSRGEEDLCGRISASADGARLRCGGGFLEERGGLMRRRSRAGVDLR